MEVHESISFIETSQMFREHTLMTSIDIIPVALGVAIKALFPRVLTLLLSSIPVLALTIVSSIPLYSISLSFL